MNPAASLYYLRINFVLFSYYTDGGKRPARHTTAVFLFHFYGCLNDDSTEGQKSKDIRNYHKSVEKIRQ